jgi:hypothetical protein
MEHQVTTFAINCRTISTYLLSSGPISFPTTAEGVFLRSSTHRFQLFALLFG